MKLNRMLIGAAFATVAALALSVVPGTAEARSPLQAEFFGAPEVTKAPYEFGKGGISEAASWCPDSRGDGQDEYRITLTVQDKQTGKSVHFSDSRAGRQYGVLPARVRPGTYRVTTTNQCEKGGPTVTDRRSVKVGYLTDSQTVSRGEWKRIKNGMTRKKIQSVTGGKLESNGSRWWAKPTTSFQTTAAFKFNKKGKLTAKYWQGFSD